MAQETVGTVSLLKNRKNVGLIKTLLAAFADPRTSGNATDDMSQIFSSTSKYIDILSSALEWE